MFVVNLHGFFEIAMNKIKLIRKVRVMQKLSEARGIKREFKSNVMLWLVALRMQFLALSVTPKDEQ
jgi:hypothetical protein